MKIIQNSGNKSEDRQQGLCAAAPRPLATYTHYSQQQEFTNFYYCMESFGIWVLIAMLVARTVGRRSTADTPQVRIERLRRRYTPHSGVLKYKDIGPELNIASIVQTITDAADEIGVDLPEGIMREAEALIALALALSECQSIKQMMAIIFLYVRDHFSQSMTTTICTYVNDLFNKRTPQSDDELPKWLTALKETQSHWQVFQNNHAWKHMQDLLCILVSVGLCEATSLEFSIGGYEMVSKEMLERQKEGTDLIDAILNVVVFFSQGAYLCFKKGSIMPLLMSDTGAHEIDEEYVEVLKMWDLVHSGNLQKIMDKTEAEFVDRLERLAGKLKTVKESLHGFDRRLVMQKIERLALISNDYTTLKVSCGVREAPFCIELFGDSAQGKTTLGEVLVSGMLASRGYPQTPNYRAIIDPAEKYQSTWFTNKLVAVFDDLANTKAQFSEVSPVSHLIKYCNNQTAVANKADIQDKGKCFIEPKIVMVTTNNKTLNANQYSTCPYSIQRRMHVVVTVKAKEEFQRVDSRGTPCGIDTQKVIDSQMVDGVHVKPKVDDIWTLTLEQAVNPGNMTAVAHYEPITWRGKEMTDISAMECLEFMCESFEKHEKAQKLMIANAKTNESKFTICEGCKKLDVLCKCQRTPHMGWMKPFPRKRAPRFSITTAFPGSGLASSLQYVFTLLTGRWWEGLYFMETIAADVLYEQLTMFAYNWDWLQIFPDSWFNSWYFQEALRIAFLRAGDLYFKIILWLSFIFHIWLLVKFRDAWYVIIASYFFFKRHFVNAIFYVYIERLRHKRHWRISPIVKRTRETYGHHFLSVFGALGGIYLLIRVLTYIFKNKEPQSGLNPETPAEIEKRDKQENQWLKVEHERLPTGGDCTDFKDLYALLDKNLFHGTICKGDKCFVLNTLFIDSNLCLVPQHYFDSHGHTLNVLCRKDDSGRSGSSFTTVLSEYTSVRLQGDMRLCYSPNGGSFRNLRKHFPEEEIEHAPFAMKWRKKDGTCFEHRGKFLMRQTTNGSYQFRGGDYINLSATTFNGMCGAVGVSQNRDTRIVMFHVGGQAGTPDGCGLQYTQLEIESAIDELRTKEGVLLTSSDAEFRSIQMGTTFMNGETKPAPKSPLNFLTGQSQIRYMGGCIGATSSYSDVRQTPISSSIQQHCGVRNIWGKPKFKPDWEGWQKCLAIIAEPAKPFPPELLAKAVIDYKTPLLKIIDRLTYWRCQPLSETEALCGIPGRKFMDAIKLNTSIGYPLGGSKRKHVIELPPTEEFPNLRELTPEIMDEIREVEEIFRKGERAYCIAKACKKDEVLPVAKGKCRIFYGNTIALTFLVRKYFLPVLRFIQMNPLVSECAVGVNSHGPEWDELHRHMIHHGKSKIFAGDYSKYDQRMPAQLIAAALRICCDLAEAMGYSEGDIRLMHSLSGELVYPYIAYNGDMVSLTSGTHISGNSLTVILNSIVGSLNLRCFYYSVYPLDKIGSFQQHVNIITYGDDNKGSVSDEKPLFNIKACSEFLGTYGQIYTMPDKESELLPYMHDDDAEFLKRRSVYHEALDCHVGALDENSIFKSLHCYMRGKGSVLTPEEACATNIDGAIREWFNHGKDIFVERQKQMKAVALDHQLTHMCSLLDVTYEQMCQDWRVKYVEAEESA